MTRNIDVIKAFVYGEQAHTLNLMSSGDKLINYSTCIAQRKDGKVYVTDTKFQHLLVKYKMPCVKSC